MSFHYKGTVNEVDSEGFEAPLWARVAITQKTLDDLTTTRSSLEVETRELDGNLQKMVYSNYSNYAAGTKLIGGLKDKVDLMTSQLKKLQAVIEGNQAYLSEVVADTIEGGHAVERLVAITATLEGVRLLLELPARLKRCVATNNLSSGVRLWVRGRDALSVQSNRASLAFIREQCEPVVEVIRARLWNRVESCENIADDVKALRQFGQKREEIDFELRARLAGKIREGLDDDSSIEVLASASVVLARSMLQAGLGNDDIVAAAVELIAPRLAEMATAACNTAVRTSEHSILSDCASVIAAQLSEVARSLGEHLPQQAVELFIAKAISAHISRSVAADSFAHYDPSALEGLAATTFSRGIVAYYLSLSPCFEGAECPKRDMAPMSGLSRGLLLRHAHLEALRIAHRIRRLVENIEGCPEPSVGTLGSATIASLNAAAAKLADAAQQAPDSLRKPKTEELAQYIVDSTMATIIDVIRLLVITDEHVFMQLAVDVRYIRDGLLSFGVEAAAVTQWYARAGSSLKDRCAVDLEISESAIVAAVSSFTPPDTSQARAVSTPHEAGRGVPEAWKKSSLLGGGKYSSVYKGIRPDGSVDAVKVVPVDSAAMENLPSLLEEVKSFTRICHKNIVRLYGCQWCEAAMEVNLFTEYVDGTTLGSLVRRTPSRLKEFRVS
eukprot:TRINITY_DN7939_c0_g1_i1.p1 TRINITY_DN7939_c0_g1~~TRINITY_DN7939_c0_g1_i1.p1  ORF type:complete len:670 (+),score=148.37 TRINITY_DN7939_c0_g1_i1:655-2664(+)